MSPNSVPNLETLFGSPQICECEECLSVVSPAAYLVDLLETILKNSITATASGQTRNGIDILKAWPKAGAPGETVDRRPDIVRLELSCDNTKIRVPYIDRVNEILENAIVAGTPQPATLGTEDELGANPQYVNEMVYDAAAIGKSVASAVYPWDLPFDLWTTEGRIYLEQLGMPRPELMAALRKRPGGEPLTDGDAKILIDDAIVAESLGLTPLERDIIVGATPADPEGAWRCWGFTDQEKGSWVDGVKALKLKSLDSAPLEGFLGRAGLEYEDLLDLLPTRFLNPGGAADPNRIDFYSADPASCNLATIGLTNLDKNLLGRLHRFVRLKRKLGWSFLELDQASTALNGAQIDPPFLARLSHIQQLRCRFGIPLDELLTWWAPLDTRGDREGKNSLYQRVFQNKSIQSSFSTVQGSFSLNEPTRDELANANSKAIPVELIPPIAAAVGLTVTDIGMLKEANEFPDAFTLATLSRIFRIASFARALKIGIPDYLSLRVLLSGPGQPIPLDPFDPAHTEQTVQFIQEVDQNGQAGFKPFELDYLLRNRPTPLGGLVPPADTILDLIKRIRDGLVRIDKETFSTADPEGEVTAKKIATYVMPDRVADALAIVGGTSTMPPVDQTTFLEDTFAFFGADVAKVLAADLIPGPATAAARYSVFLDRIATFERRNERASLALSKLTAAFAVDPLTKKLDSGVIDKLLTGGETGTGAIHSRLDSTQVVLQDFLPNDSAMSDWMDGIDRVAASSRPPGQDLRDAVATLIGTGAPTGKFTQLLGQIEGLLLVRKVAIVLNRLRATTDEIPWILKDGVRSGWTGWLDPESFSGPKPDYPAFRRLIDLFTVRSAYPSGTVLGVIARVDAGMTDAAIVTFLSDQTRWPAKDLDTLAGTDVLGLATAEWLHEGALRRLMRGMTTARRLGVSVSQALAWCQSPLRADQARQIKGALKAATGDVGWLDRTKPLQDTLRERRRNALVSFLVGNPGYGGLPAFPDANALFDYFLIDTQMSPCMTISRISQAIASVQLLIQRCLMGFEKYPDGASEAPVLINADAVRWWAWMATYQIWVAARIVFLHPDGYLHEELRYDKSPIFKDIENQLLQGDLNAESAEQAYRDYLEKYQEVARLEIAGIFHEAAADDKPDVLHVFGRTSGSPHHYYYRTRTILSDGPEWSAWERVNVDIPGDHLMPIVWNRRLHLFWPVFTEKAVSSQSGDTTPPNKYFAIQLAFSEYRHGKWSAKRLSSGLLVASEPNGIEGKNIDASRMLLRAGIEPGGDLVINCYCRPETGNWSVAYFRSTCTGSLVSTVSTGLNTNGDIYLVPTGGLLTWPLGTQQSYQAFAGKSEAGLQLPIAAGQDQEAVLTQTPTSFCIHYPTAAADASSFGDFLFRDTFFYEDANRTFLVEPVVQPEIRWQEGDSMSPSVFFDPRAATTVVNRPHVERIIR